MPKLLLFLALIMALFVDGSFLSLPLVFAICILFYILEPKPETVVIIFIAGILIDVLRLTTIGSTSIFLLASCFFIYLYRNTFELKDMRVIILFPFIFAFIYANLFGYNNGILIYAGLLALAEGVLYYLSRKAKPQLVNI